MVPGILLFLFMIFMPESPRWLARKDKWEECHRILTLIHGKGDPDSPFVQYELNDIKEACALEAKFADVTYWELFYPKNLYRTHIGEWMDGMIIYHLEPRRLINIQACSLRFGLS
jgi:hypothetical protein